MNLARAALGLGSNLGDREGHLRAGIARIEASGRVRVLSRSRVRETAPVGGPPQPPYLNAAILVETDLSPKELLDLAKRVEAAQGREPAPRDHPRTLDVDLLLYENRVVREEGLVIPHPRLLERAFALDPLAEIAPDWVHPVAGKTVASLAAALASLSPQDPLPVP